MGEVSLQLSSPVEAIPGVTQRQAQGLRALGISNLGWLMAHLPLRHERIEAEATIDQLEPESTACARGEVTPGSPALPSWRHFLIGKSTIGASTRALCTRR